MRRSTSPPLLTLLLLVAACADSSAPPPPRADAAGGTDTAVAPAESTAPAGMPSSAGVETIALDPANTQITFVGEKVIGRHDGRFDQHSGTLHLDPAAPEKSHLVIQIDTASVWTDEEKLTAHLKTPDFFAVEQFPQASFESTAIEPAAGPDVTHHVKGNLTLRGVTREVTIPLRVQLTADRVQADGTFTIDRQDFDIEYPGAPDNLIQDEVKIAVKVDAPRTSGA